MKILSEFTVNELEHAIWINSLGSVAVGGYSPDAYRQELMRRESENQGLKDSSS